ncbi:MAG: hypothetical protein H6839_11590 [Planctomycetes bacterium]|nr:hypothetical protein [Planctomycetota bacterium]
MSLNIRCKCGWNSQVSDFYLGDRVACPDCDEKIAVHASSNVPYGYPPYKDWAKQTAPVMRAPAFRPAARDLMVVARDPHAGTALGLGIASVLAVLSVCALLPGLILAVFALYSAHRSKQWNVSHRRATDGRARAGFVMSWAALVIAALMFGSLVFDGRPSHRPVVPPEVIAPPRTTPVVPAPPKHRYPDARPALPPLNTIPQPGMRYPSVPKPEPVVPRNDFERKQLRYSQKVRQERQQPAPGGPKPGNRYGK